MAQYNKNYGGHRNQRYQNEQSYQTTNTAEVVSNYNFVPAPKEGEVYHPEWADKISHDMPFIDGVNGEIEVKIEAVTPIFIRNGHAQGKDTSEFSNVDGEYFIPATSIKGMLRNTLEIMSFSNLNKKFINDHRYSYRDISSANSRYMQRYGKEKVLAGWLKQDNFGNWKIEECADLAFINHKELLKVKNIPFRDLFLGNNPINKYAKYKYENESVKKVGLIHKFSIEKVNLFGNVDKNIARFDDNGKEGTLVFTGQPGKRSEFSKEKKEEASLEGKTLKDKGKINEFVFFSSSSPNILEVLNKSDENLHLSEFTKEDFLFIYLDHDRVNISPDWKYWKGKFNSGEKVPVFFQKNNKGQIAHFGLSFMYKLPYRFSIHQLIKKNDKIDLAEVIFGTTEKNFGLKGRVFISNAIVLNQPLVLNEKKEILGSPKASYFPYYLEQKNEKNFNYQTYDDEATLKGFKRYPVHIKEKNTPYTDNQLRKEKVFTKFKPLSSGTKFNFKLRYFNLRPIELGAILSSLTFHGNHERLFHSLGGAKPLGYGKVKISVDLSNDTLREAMIFFEEEMNKHCKSVESIQNEWIKSDQIKELFAMASEPDEKLDKTLRYPQLEKPDVPSREANEFIKVKRNSEFLKPYSELNTFDLGTNSIKNENSPITIENSKISQEELLIRLQDQPELEGDFQKFPDLSKHLNEIYNEWKGFSPHNQIYIIEMIKHLYQNHKDSRNKLNKPYDWENNITKWLGSNQAKSLYEELTKSSN